MSWQCSYLMRSEAPGVEAERPAFGEARYGCAVASRGCPRLLGSHRLGRPSSKTRRPVLGFARDAEDPSGSSHLLGDPAGLVHKLGRGLGVHLRVQLGLGRGDRVQQRALPFGPLRGLFIRLHHQSGGTERRAIVRALGVLPPVFPLRRPRRTRATSAITASMSGTKTSMSTLMAPSTLAAGRGSVVMSLT